ncbi:DUF6678 family protein [Moritella sp. 28]|uniref:DUF6678 family protein n=1 Tax=Moritella sp. 28 TaxID=2746232 RepID=UPI00351D5DF1
MDSNLKNLISLSNNSRWISLFEDLKNVDEMLLFRSKNVDGSFFQTKNLVIHIHLKLNNIMVILNL